MKVTKWIDFSQEVTIEIGSDDIRVALSEAFANALPIGKGREEPSRQDILIAFNAAGAFMRAMTDEDIALMLSRATGRDRKVPRGRGAALPGEIRMHTRTPQRGRHLPELRS